MEKGEVDLLVWIAAGSRETIQLGYLAAARAVDEGPTGKVEVKGFLRWLAETSRRWLVVVDGLSEVDDLRALWPPRHASGRTVVTTRIYDNVFGDGVHRAFVREFDVEEALAYLHERQDGSPHRTKGAAELADQLFKSPLAMALAANYVASRNTTYAEYRRLWVARCDQAEHPHGLLSRTYSRLPSGFTFHIESVAACSLLLDLASGLTRTVLDLASLVDGGAIPMAFFETSAIARHLTVSEGRNVTTNDVRDALAGAHRLGLVTIDAQRIVRLDAWMRRVLLDYRQFATLGTITSWGWTSPRHDWPVRGERAAGDALVEAWPDARDLVGNQMFFAATCTLYSWASFRLWNNGGHPMLVRAGSALKNAGLLESAAAYFKQLHDTARHELGEDHDETKTINGNLVTVRSLIMRGQVTDLDEQLAEQTRTLGARNRVTLATHSQVAFDHATAAPGDPSNVEMLKNVLAEQQRLLGRKDPDTLWTRFLIAKLRAISGDLDGASRELKDLLRDERRALGLEHVNTLHTRQLLATLRIEMDDTSGIDRVMRNLIRDQERVLGRKSELALITRGQLAVVRHRCGETAEAVTELEAVLADFSRVRGADHREALAMRRHLAAMYSTLGDYVGALAELELTMNYASNVLSRDDDDLDRTRDALNEYRHIAYWQIEHEYKRACDGDQLLFEQLKAVISDAHHARNALAMAGQWADLLAMDGAPRNAEDTLAIQRIAACWRGLAGEPSRAATELEQILDHCGQVLGPDCWLTRFARHNLAHWRTRAGRP